MSPDERGTHLQDWIDSFTIAPDCIVDKYLEADKLRGQLRLLPALTEIREYLRELIEEDLGEIGEALLYDANCGFIVHQWWRQMHLHKPKRVFFNNAVQVKTYRFNSWERGWRKWQSGHTARVWQALAARYDQAREAVGSAHRSTPRQPPRLRKIRWLGDTGASWHMIGKQNLKEDELRNARPSDRKVQLATANGTITTDLCVDVKPTSISLKQGPLLIDKCPPII